MYPTERRKWLPLTNLHTQAVAVQAAQTPHSHHHRTIPSSIRANSPLPNLTLPHSPLPPQGILRPPPTSAGLLRLSTQIHGRQLPWAATSPGNLSWQQYTGDDMESGIPQQPVQGEWVFRQLHLELRGADSELPQQPVLPRQPVLWRVLLSGKSEFGRFCGRSSSTGA